MVLLMTYGNTGTVYAQNSELERAVSQGQIQDKIKTENSANVFLLSTPNAEGSDSKEDDVECQDVKDQDVKDQDVKDQDVKDQDVKDCFNTESDDNKEDKEKQSSTDILLPFP
jgi:hypothetical protein